MAPGNKIPANNPESKENLSRPPCPYCGFSHCWRHGKRFRKGFHRRQAEPRPEPVPIQRYICRDPPCKRTFSVLPEEVLPYCRFFLSDLLNLSQTLAEGWSAYWIAKHQWELSLRVILRVGLLIQKAKLWLEDVCRKTALSFGADLQSLVELALKTFSWFGFTQRWFQYLYPCRTGRVLTPHNLGIKRL